MVNWKMDEVYDKILEDDTMNNDTKLVYHKMLKINSLLNHEEAIEYEDSIYTVDGKVLNNKERVMFELNRLGKDDEQDDRLIRLLAYKTELCKNDEYDNIKKGISLLQLNRGITPKFFSVIDSLLEDKSKEYNIKDRTYKEVTKKRCR